MILDELGRPQWHRLQRRHVIRRADRARQAAAADPAALFAFDLLAVDGRDQRALPLIKRKTALRRTLAGLDRVRYAEHFEDCCKDLWAAANELQLEGIVAKDAAST